MNRHLSDVEMVDVLDGALPPARAAHLGDCGACRERVEWFRAIVSRVEQTDGNSVPEPSPLFWDHFSARVSEAISGIDAPRQREGWQRPPSAAWLAVAAALVLAASVVFWNSDRRTHAPSPVATVQEPIAPSSDDTQVDLDQDAAWALVRVAADDLQWEDAPDAGLNAGPGSAETVALELSALERQELARLLAVELKS